MFGNRIKLEIIFYLYVMPVFRESFVLKTDIWSSADKLDTLFFVVLFLFPKKGITSEARPCFSSDLHREKSKQDNRN